MTYKDSNMPIEARIKDLLTKMTLEEKLAQIVLYPNTDELYDRGMNGEFPEEGASGMFVCRDTPRDQIQKTQKASISGSRLGIPLLVMGESLHGVMYPNATIFPQSIGMGATFNIELMGEISDAIGKEAKFVGIRQVYAPNIDVSRDPRWGRTEENFGEDPYLTSKMGVAYINGIQKNNVAATVKHYIAYGCPEGGINIAPAHIGEREIRETMLEPFKSAIQDSKVMSVMPSYNEIDGVPVHSSRYYLNDVLRDELGFDGYTVSDYSALSMLKDLHKTCENSLEAGKRALHAGIDFEAPDRDAYGEDFKNAVISGEIPMAELDLAVERILRVKFRLGLFDEKTKDFSSEETTEPVLHTAKHVELARKAAQEAIVLLKNQENILPLRKNIKVAVVGPNAAVSQLGDYTAPNVDYAVSIKDGLEARLGSDNVLYQRGSGIAGGTNEEIKQAVQAVNCADVAIVVLGDNSNFFGGIGWGDDGVGAAVTSGEGFDVADLIIPEAQRKLLESVSGVAKAKGIPVVLILVTGRPYCIGNECDLSDAVLEAWYPGEQGGNAICDILWGDVCPSGKLPISFPHSAGQLPCYYNYKNSARGYYKRPGSLDNPGRDYVFCSPAPLFPFGFGLSYTDFSYSDLMVTADKETAKVSVSVKNIGSVAAYETVLLFLSDCCCRITPFVRRLRAFEKIQLEPGETKVVNFTLGFDDFAFINENMRQEVEPGDFDVEIGGLSVRFSI